MTNIPTAEIKAIVLYGSHARGDSDGESDVDVCVFTEDQKAITIEEIAFFLPVLQSLHLSLTAYCQADLTAMIEYGSLFLWHLKLEGRIAYGEEYLSSRFIELQPFVKHQSEIEYHHQIFDDLTTSAREWGRGNEFDLGLLFTIARNTCMVLAHKAGRPAFGRLSCYRAAMSAYDDLPLDERTYIELSQWKLVYERGAEVPGTLPSCEEMHRLLAIIRNLLEYANARTG